MCWGARLESLGGTPGPGLPDSGSHAPLGGGARLPAAFVWIGGVCARETQRVAATEAKQCVVLGGVAPASLTSGARDEKGRQAWECGRLGRGARETDDFAGDR